jgi:hypothetical protein
MGEQVADAMQAALGGSCSNAGSKPLRRSTEALLAEPSCR